MVHSFYTIFQDIDGCLLHHTPTPQAAAEWAEPMVLAGTLAKLVSWWEKGYKLILTTGRKECYRDYTEWQLRRAGIMYDQLVMDVGTGPRVLINDNKADEPVPKAQCFNLRRNQGIADLPI